MSEFTSTIGSTEVRPVVSLPSDGEGLISPRTLAQALDVAESTLWNWVKTKSDFPQPLRRGERFTRFRLSDVRRFMAAMSSGEAKVSPAVRARDAVAP